MRLFTGLDLSNDVLSNIEGLLNRLRPAADIRWSPAANLHITTKFIGQWPEERLDELKAALAAVPKRGVLPVRIRRVGFFPNPHAPRAFWCGIEAPGLAELAADTGAACASLGIARENRPYSPHLTLARIKDRVPMQPLREAIAALPALEFGAFDAASFFLYHSRPGPGGSVYTKLAEFPLVQS
jgi:2'-5' RNA ligase